MGWTRPHQAALCWLLGQDKPTREVSLTLRGMGAGCSEAPGLGAMARGRGVQGLPLPLGAMAPVPQSPALGGRLGLREQR